MEVANILKNHRGQAFIEALAILFISAPMILMILVLFINALNSLAIDHFLEGHLVCIALNTAACKEHTLNNLQQLQIKNIELTEFKNPPHYEVHLRGQTYFGKNISQDRILQIQFDLE